LENRVIHIALCLLFLLGFGASAQKKTDDLKKQEREIQKKIESTKSLIQSARSTQQLTIAELGIINHQIAYREELMRNLNFQAKQVEQEIVEINKIISSLESDLTRLKEEYAKMAQYAFKFRYSEYKLMHVFSANTFAEAYFRSKFIQQYTSYRKRQAEKIVSTQAELKQRIAELDSVKEEKRKLLSQQASEKENFVKDKELQQKSLQQLKTQEQRLLADLKQQEKKRQELAAKIRKAIEEEMRAKEREAAKSAKTTTSAGFALSPEAALESKNFESNKGKLPWPVEQGEITGLFGIHKHEVVKDVEVKNNGIDISTTKNAEVRAVFEGTVTSILVISGAGKVLMISHGAYITVYSNLQEVYVAKGDKVATKQKIGRLLPKDDSNISEAHFELWRITSGDPQKENPNHWIYRR
jgi:murein hydrolase activator